jgi:hypothetical protein
MATYFKTNTPNKLLTSFKKAIDDGHIVTWAYDKDGDFTHTAPQWKDKAWLRPTVQNDRLVFNILAPKNISLTDEVYAIYHGRIIESLLAHFDSLFTEGVATAMASGGDLV